MKDVDAGPRRLDVSCRIYEASSGFSTEGTSRYTEFGYQPYEGIINRSFGVT